MDGYKNDPEKLSMTKVDELIPSGFSIPSFIQRHKK